MFEGFRYYKRDFGKKSIDSTSREETDFLTSADFYQQAARLDIQYRRTVGKGGNILITCYDLDQADKVERILNENGFLKDKKKRYRT